MSRSPYKQKREILQLLEVLLRTVIIIVVSAKCSAFPGVVESGTPEERVPVSLLGKRVPHSAKDEGQM
jgi:hypothetical protein